MKIKKRALLMFILMFISGLAGSFLIGGLAGLGVHRFAHGPDSPEMFGWYGLFLVTGINLAMFCAPGCLIMAGFLAARSGPFQVLLCFPLSGLISLVALTLWYLFDETLATVILAPAASAACAFIIGRLGSRNLQNNRPELTGAPLRESPDAQP
jgi:MFS family permease